MTSVDLQIIGNTWLEFPSVNVWSNDNETVVAAEIPGVDPKQVSLTVTGDVLTIEVELTKWRGKIGRAKGACRVGDDVVSEAEVTFMLVDA